VPVLESQASYWAKAGALKALGETSNVMRHHQDKHVYEVATPVILSCFEASEPEVRQAAIIAMCNMECQFSEATQQRVANAIWSVLLNDQNPDVQAACISRSGFGDVANTLKRREHILSIASSQHIAIRCAFASVAWELCRIDSNDRYYATQVAQALMLYSSDANKRVRAWTIDSLGMITGQFKLTFTGPSFEIALQDKTPEVRHKAMFALLELPKPQAKQLVPLLATLLGDDAHHSDATFVLEQLSESGNELKAIESVPYTDLDSDYGQAKPIKTALGTLGGRDCLLLDNVSIPDTKTAVITGRVNGHLNQDGAGEHIPFTLTFTDVLAFKTTELQSCLWYGASSFDEVTGSAWLAKVATGDKFTDKHKQYYLQTNDEVFDVICSSYSFDIHSAAIAG